MGTLRFFEEVVSFKIRRTFGFADYRCVSGGYPTIFGGRGLLEAGQVGEYFPRLRMMTTGFALPPAL